jgi:hypothetical protein
MGSLKKMQLIQVLVCMQKNYYPLCLIIKIANSVSGIKDRAFIIKISPYRLQWEENYSHFDGFDIDLSPRI